MDRNPVVAAHIKAEQVALHPEGVDRNRKGEVDGGSNQVALHPEGVDRNQELEIEIVKELKSPSTRRAWIEIARPSIGMLSPYLSPSTRRAWIEI